MSITRTATIALLGLGVLCLPAQAHGAEQPVAPVTGPSTASAPVSTGTAAQVRQLVEALGHPEWSVREQAEEALLDRRIPIAALYRELERDTLDVEQRHRLLNIVRERIISQPRGALGIRMEPRFDDVGGIAVVGLLEGMPAQAQLVVGDRILSVEGVEVTDSLTLRGLVQSRLPGETVALRIGRPKRTPDGREMRDAQGMLVIDELHISLALGSAEDLEQFDGDRILPADPIREAREREARLAGERFAPRRVAVPIEGRDVRLAIDEMDVDDHPAVATLLTYRRLIDEGSMKISPELRAMWQSTADHLHRQAELEGLPDDMRDYYRAVSKRFDELVPQ